MSACLREFLDAQSIVQYGHGVRNAIFTYIIWPLSCIYTAMQRNAGQRAASRGDARQWHHA